MDCNMIYEMNHTDVLALLPDRAPWAHKGNFGKILMICGSRGYTGAAALASMGALRCGAGLVFLAVPESIYAIEAVKLTEPIVLPLPDKDGTLSESGTEQVLSLLAGKDAVLIGPGIGRSPGAAAVLRAVIENARMPLVIDADGINLLSAHKDLLRGRTAPTVLTPHDIEFRCLGGDLSLGRREAAQALAAELNAIVLLKGHETWITDGTVSYCNHTGNPGMAVGGSGDLLAGMILSLIGQGIKPLEAAACGAWLHGAAGDICEKEIGQYGMLPSDMLNVLPRLLK